MYTSSLPLGAPVKKTPGVAPMGLSLLFILLCCFLVSSGLSSLSSYFVLVYGLVSSTINDPVFTSPVSWCSSNVHPGVFLLFPLSEKFLWVAPVGRSGVVMLFVPISFSLPPCPGVPSFPPLPVFSLAPSYAVHIYGFICVLSSLSPFSAFAPPLSP